MLWRSLKVRSPQHVGVVRLSLQTSRYLSISSTSWLRRVSSPQGILRLPKCYYGERSAREGPSVLREHEIPELVPPDLPDGATLVEKGRALARSLRVGTTRYQRRHRVRSERAYKEHCRAERTITYYINLGLKSWPETREALRWIQDECRRRKLRVDRVSLTADRRMGLPPESRAEAIEETGIMFWTKDDWAGVGTEIELQGILNDHTVGSPASIVNAAAAIEAGITYIGNLSQQSYGYPNWSDDVAQMANTVVAMGMLAEKKEDGVVLDSYIDDGYC